jgi:ribose transport system substrate-binding protein
MRSRLCLLFAALVLLAGCQPAAKTKVLGIVPKGASHLFWETVRAGAAKAAGEQGYTIEWNAPSLEIDASRQIAILDSMINRRLAGIAIAPVDRKALVPAVERAMAAGIPVVIFDSAIETANRVSYVATNNEEGGRIAARRLASVIGAKGKVGVVSFMPGSAATEERSHGFQDEIRKNFPNINIVGVQYGMANRAKALAVPENILTAHPDLAGLFADNESSSSGAVQALKTRGLKGVKLVAFDHATNLVEDLRAGWIDSLLVQNPYKMGFESARFLIQKLNGGTPPAALDSGITLVTAADLAKPDVQALLNPITDSSH